MPTTAVKNESTCDVLVVGEHPAAALAAALLARGGKLEVIYASLRAQGPGGRLMSVNPAFFELNGFTKELFVKLKLKPVLGLKFFSDDVAVHSEYRSTEPVAFITPYAKLREEMCEIAQHQGAQCVCIKSMEIVRIDEQGMDILLGKKNVRARVLVLADRLSNEQHGVLGMPDGWGPGIVHRYTSVRCKNGQFLNLDEPALMPMSLNLGGKLSWAWLLPGDGEFQITIEEPVERAGGLSDEALLGKWVEILQQHRILQSNFAYPASAMTRMELPLAGALVQEGVANRTVLIGPAGGFYSASGEDIYPNCWSALFAETVVRKALRESHLQDALNPYRHLWRTTLGEYLRGPRENLRFLLPIVYRNKEMTARLGEAILLGKSVVR